MIERRLVSRPVSTIGTLIAPRVTQEEGPPIVTEGLVLHLDAGNPYSYPGTGTTWTSIAGTATNHDCPLTNGPVFVRDGYGAIDFDGTNDFGTINNSLNGDFNFGAVSGNTNDFALEAVVMHDSTASLQNYLRPHAGSTTSAALFRSYNMKVNWAYWNASNVNQASLWGNIVMSTGKWYHVMATRVAGLHSLYVNGVLDVTATNNSANAVNPVTEMAVGRYPFGTPGSEWMNGKIAILRVYKQKTMGESEVLQNFASMRWRFGI